MEAPETNGASRCTGSLTVPMERPEPMEPGADATEPIEPHGAPVFLQKCSKLLCFLLFFGVWFLDGFGDRSFVILGWILEHLGSQNRLNSVIDFGIDF